MGSTAGSTPGPTASSPQEPTNSRNGQFGSAPLQVSLSPTTAAPRSLPPGPVISPHSPATTAVEPAQAEAALSKPSEGPLSPSKPAAITQDVTSAYVPHLARQASESDYFTPASRFHSAPSASVAQEPIAAATRPTQNARDAHTFVEAAREELYGNSRTIDLTSQTERLNDAIHTSAPPQQFSTLSRSTTQRSVPVRSRTEHPTFPNQSLAALHSQIIHPRATSASSNYSHNRWASSSQSNLFAPSTALSTGHRLDDELNDHIISPRTSRTAGNTPQQTPGLFPTTNVHHLALHPFNLEGTVDELSEGSLQASPYLHPAQQQPPRTVTSADRQVDTFSGRKIINHYEMYGELGRGVHGKVKLARDLVTGKDVAIKIVSRYSKKTRLGKVDKPEDKVKREVAILKKIQHPNVVGLIEVIDDPDIAKVYLVLEFCELKEVEWRHTGYPEIILAEHSRQLAEFQQLPKEDQDAGWKKIGVERRHKRKREARRVPRRRATSGAEEQESHMWSLEYGGETDDESYAASEPASSEPAMETSTEEQNAEHAPASEVADLDLRKHTTSSSSGRESRSLSSPVASDSHLVDFGRRLQKTALATTSALKAKPSEASTNNPESGSHVEGFSFYSTEWYQSDSPAMRGPTLDQIRELRDVGRGSVTASSISGFTDHYESEVPEDSRYVPTMSLSECRTTFRDALVGIEYLHYHGIVHRDIKPENLLRNRDRRVKISDFGVSYLGRPVHKGDDSGDVSDVEANNFDEETALAKTVGTPAFYAPELCSLDVESDAPVVTGQIDLWALGVTLFCLLFARTPFTAENQFILMRKISEEEIFIPRLRLKAVNPLLRSPGPEGALYAPDKRLPDQWLHEPIEDELYDLLVKLFEKNPRDRITIHELKRHPWVLKDLPSPSDWLQETDPVNFGFGKKIEPSKEEVADAVIPIKIVERIRSLTKRASSALGLAGRRKRGQSSTASSEGGSGSTHDALNKDLRRQSLQSSDALFSAFKSSKEKDSHEHPLAMSVTASPTSEIKAEFIEDSVSPTSSTASPNPPSAGSPAIQSRPGMPDRQISEMSTAASIRTIRQSDIDRGRQTNASPPSQEASEKPGGGHADGLVSSSLRTIFGNAGRTILRTMSRDGNERASSGSSAKSASPGPGKRNSSVHGEPDVAVSNAATSSHLDVPAQGPQRHPGSSRNSRSVSGEESTSDLAQSTKVPSSSNTQTAGQSTPAILDHQNRHHMSPVDFGGGMSRGTGTFTARDEEPTDEEYHKAIDDLNRRRILQDIQNQEHLNASRPQSSYAELACPPSPDDESPDPPHQSESQPQNYFVSNFSPSSTAFSSEDHLVSDQSRSTSYPSIPSVLSADSSEVSEPNSKADYSSSSSEGTAHTHINTPTYPSANTYGPEPESDDGYAGDGDENGEELSAIADDDYDDSDSSGSDDDFLHLGRPKNKPSAPGNLKRELNSEEASKNPTHKTERSGSTHTMKKVIPGEGTADEAPT